MKITKLFKDILDVYDFNCKFSIIKEKLISMSYVVKLFFWFFFLFFFQLPSDFRNYGSILIVNTC